MAMNGVHGALGPLRSLPEVVRASPKLGVWLYFAMPVLLIALGVASILAWGEVAMFIVVLAKRPLFRVSQLRAATRLAYRPHNAITADRVRVLEGD